MSNEKADLDTDKIKSCCTKFYETDMLTKFLGDSFHPGGEELTVKLGEKLGLDENSKVLDVACGPGSSAIVLAKTFDCSVTGIDLSEKNLELAKERAELQGLADKLRFLKSDAERIELDDESFDAVISECSLCTFPDKDTAVSEMYRLLKPGGKVGITDIVINGELSEDLNNIISHVLCIAGALSEEGYQTLLKDHGFNEIIYEDHSYTISDMIKKADRMLAGVDMIEKLFNFDLEKMFGVTSAQAKNLVKTALEEVEKGTIGYGLFVCWK